MSFWSVAQTESQREGVAAEFLKQDGFETYLPKIIVKQAARERIMPLFPGYLFVRVVDRWYAIRWTVGVIRLLLTDGLPAQIGDKVMATIQKREGENGLIRLPKAPGLRRGQMVRIARGSFADRIGVFDGMAGPDRVRVLIDLLGRSVPVSIARCDIVVADQIAASCVPV